MSKALLTAFSYTLFLLPTPFYLLSASLTETENTMAFNRD